MTHDQFMQQSASKLFINQWQLHMTHDQLMQQSASKLFINQWQLHNCKTFLFATSIPHLREMNHLSQTIQRVSSTRFTSWCHQLLHELQSEFMKYCDSNCNMQLHYYQPIKFQVCTKFHSQMNVLDFLHAGESLKDRRQQSQKTGDETRVQW